VFDVVVVGEDEPAVAAVVASEAASLLRGEGEGPFESNEAVLR
jgi:hypothetical protein